MKLNGEGKFIGTETRKSKDNNIYIVGHFLLGYDVLSVNLGDVKVPEMEVGTDVYLDLDFNLTYKYFKLIEINLVM